MKERKQNIDWVEVEQSIKDISNSIKAHHLVKYPNHLKNLAVHFLPVIKLLKKQSYEEFDILYDNFQISAFPAGELDSRPHYFVAIIPPVVFFNGSTTHFTVSLVNNYEEDQGKRFVKEENIHFSEPQVIVRTFEKFLSEIVP